MTSSQNRCPKFSTKTPASNYVPPQTRWQTIATPCALDAHDPHDLIGMMIGHTHPGTSQGAEQRVAEIAATGGANLR